MTACETSDAAMNAQDKFERERPESSDNREQACTARAAKKLSETSLDVAQAQATVDKPIGVKDWSRPAAFVAAAKKRAVEAGVDTLRWANDQRTFANK